MRLHVAMDDAQLVREGERTGDLAGELERAPYGQRALADDHRLQVLARDVLEDDELAPFPLAAVDDRDHVGVRKPRDRPSLTAKALDVLGVTGEVLVQDLDRHPALEHRVVRAVHARHAALADELLQLVATDDQLSDVHRHTVPCRRRLGG